MSFEKSPARRGTDTKIDRPNVDLYDPWQQHFVSQNKRNEFLKTLEGLRATADFPRPDLSVRGQGADREDPKPNKIDRGGHRNGNADDRRRIGDGHAA